MRVGLFCASSSALALAVAVSVAATLGGRGTATLAAPPQGGGGAQPAAAPQEPPITLPSTNDSTGKPKINGPRITGGNVGHIFLYKLPATGDGPEHRDLRL